MKYAVDFIMRFWHGDICDAVFYINYCCLCLRVMLLIGIRNELIRNEYDEENNMRSTMQLDQSLLRLLALVTPLYFTRSEFGLNKFLFKVQYIYLCSYHFISYHN